MLLEVNLIEVVFFFFWKYQIIGKQSMILLFELILRSRSFGCGVEVLQKLHYFLCEDICTKSSLPFTLQSLFYDKMPE